MKKTKDEIQQAIVDILKPPVHGLAKLPMRVGKTKIGIDVIKRDKPKKVLWVTVSEELRDVEIPGEFRTWGATTYLTVTRIVCWQSLSKIKGEFDLIILDEFQKITPANSRNLLNGSLKGSILGLSGTMPKQEEKLSIYKELGLKVLVSMEVDEAVALGLIAPYEITVVEVPLNNRDKVVDAGSKTKPFKTTEKGQYDYMCRNIQKMMFSGRPVPKFFYLNRSRFIYNLDSKNSFARDFVARLRGRTLVFTGSISEADKYPNSYHSKTSDLNLKSFQEGKIDQLACVNSGGIGFTFRNVDNFVIVQVNSNSSGDATQKVGRALVAQEGYKANIYIIVARDTVDEKWKDLVLEDFDERNVNHVSYLNYVKRR